MEIGHLITCLTGRPRSCLGFVHIKDQLLPHTSQAMSVKVEGLSAIQYSQRPLKLHTKIPSTPLSVQWTRIQRTTQPSLLLNPAFQQLGLGNKSISFNLKNCDLELFIEETVEDVQELLKFTWCFMNWPSATQWWTDAFRLDFDLGFQSGILPLTVGNFRTHIYCEVKLKKCIMCVMKWRALPHHPYSVKIVCLVFMWYPRPWWPLTLNVFSILFLLVSYDATYKC